MYLAGADNPVGSFFHKHKYSVNLVICYKYFLLNYFVTVFSRSNTKATKFDLSLHIGQGQSRVIIYINVVERA